MFAEIKVPSEDGYGTMLAEIKNDGLLVQFKIPLKTGTVPCLYQGPP